MNGSSSNSDHHHDNFRPQQPPKKPSLPNLPHMPQTVSKEPPTPTEEDHSASSTTSKKPDWLEELSRKQAVRKSGLFSNKPDVKDPEPVTTSANAAVEPNKPQVPLKPSQIRDEARKSGSFGASSSTAPSKPIVAEKIATQPQPQPLEKPVVKSETQDLEGLSLPERVSSNK